MKCCGGLGIENFTLAIGHKDRARAKMPQADTTMAPFPRTPRSGRCCRTSVRVAVLEERGGRHRAIR